MAGKAVFVVGIAVGYVIGTRRGREGYVRLRQQANDLLHTRAAQRTAADVSKFARDNVPVVGKQIAKVVDRATSPRVATTAEDVPGNI
jgi:hypothetical protein